MQTEAHGTGAALAEPSRADREFENSRSTAEQTLLTQVGESKDGVTLREALAASDNHRANARAIVGLVSSGRLGLTDDQRLVPGES